MLPFDNKLLHSHHFCAVTHPCPDCCCTGKRYLWPVLCNTVENVARELGYDVCTGCCVGWETCGQRWNGGALRNAATRETQFGAERSITIPPFCSLPLTSYSRANILPCAQTHALTYSISPILSEQFDCMQRAPAARF